MAWTVEKAKIYLGIDPGDNTQDAAIQDTLDYVMSSVETALQRVLPLGREVTTFYHVSSARVLLPRFPVSQVHAINGASPQSDVKLHSRVGWLEHPSFVYEDELEVDYEGGYAVFPPDLDRTLWAIFMSAWSNTDQDTGGPPVDGGGVVIGGGEVERVTLSDFGSISYSTSSVSGGASSGASAEETWGWLSPWAATLESYRNGPGGAGLGIA